MAQTRVVVAHSDEQLRTSVVDALSALGFAVLPLNDSEVTWEVVSSSASECVVVVESGLPSRGGVSLCERIRKHLGKKAWVILEASRAQTRHVADGVRAGADDFANGVTDVVDRVVAGQRSLALELELEAMTARFEASLGRSVQAA
ncbi:MAG: hypothetical protein K1X89_03880 [Myxococcaceae bacterium]|nr:hypothetical protein [Myxococcaceae bacterium]